MKVLATNVGKLTPVEWKGKKEFTGIFKYPTSRGIHLGTEQVVSDNVANKKVHGGIFKACYLFGANHYSYWKQLFPDLEWNWGMFGENVTLETLEEDLITIGSIYELGTALVQITQPRQPCYKLGIRFGTQEILKQFIAKQNPGTYVRVLRQGIVKTGDKMRLKEDSKSSLTVQQFYRLLYAKEKNQTHLQWALENEALPLKKRDKIRRFLSVS